MKLKPLKLIYYCFMIKLFQFLKVEKKKNIYWAKAFVLAADIKVIGSRESIQSEYDIC